MQPGTIFLYSRRNVTLVNHTLLYFLLLLLLMGGGATETDQVQFSLAHYVGHYLGALQLSPLS